MENGRVRCPCALFQLECIRPFFQYTVEFARVLVYGWTTKGRVLFSAWQRARVAYGKLVKLKRGGESLSTFCGKLSASIWKGRLSVSLKYGLRILKHRTRFFFLHFAMIFFPQVKGLVNVEFQFERHWQMRRCRLVSTRKIKILKSNSLFQTSENVVYGEDIFFFMWTSDSCWWTSRKQNWFLRQEQRWLRTSLFRCTRFLTFTTCDRLFNALLRISRIRKYRGLDLM